MLADVLAASEDVAATRSRTKKVERLAELLKRVVPEEIPAAIGFFCGELRQGKLGLGPATLRALAAGPAATLSAVSLRELDGVFSALKDLAGKGVALERERLLGALFSRLTAAEQSFVMRLILGELRQGALEGIVLDAVARAAELPGPLVRRAMLFAGRLDDVAVSALSSGEAGLLRYSVELFRPLRPMLAQTAESAEDAWARTAPCAFEYKLDGARIQVHREGERVAVYSRQSNELSDALPEIVALARALPVSSIVLDGEAIALHADGRPQPFQVTMRRFGRRLDVEELRESLPLRAFFFDCLYLNGVVLVDRPNRERWEALCSAVAERDRVTRRVPENADEASAFLSEALARGHEGVVAKSLESTYDAGRRGAGWLKLKPAPTLDLVVLAVEWGSGRRTGLLSNLHLGARDPQTGEFVMLGKTFKGLTDAMLAWQTQKLEELAVRRDAHTVYVRPELVVEIAFDGLQKSPQYPGGLALRFARVKRYREDKPASEADTIDFVRSLFERGLGHTAEG